MHLCALLTEEAAPFTLTPIEFSTGAAVAMPALISIQTSSGLPKPSARLAQTRPMKAGTDGLWSFAFEVLPVNVCGCASLLWWLTLGVDHRRICFFFPVWHILQKGFLDNQVEVLLFFFLSKFHVTQRNFLLQYHPCARPLEKKQRSDVPPGATNGALGLTSLRS